MNELSSRIRNAILILGLVQGLLLLSAHALVTSNVVDARASLIWLVPWWSAAIGVLTALQLTLTDARDRRVWLFGLGLFIGLALTGAYAGYRVEPSTDISIVEEVMPYVLTAFIGWYVLLPFAQAALKTRSPRPDYPALFEFAWNNGITLLIAGIFTGIFWLLLRLWAGLFDVIGIGLFSTLFFNKYFAYPITAMVFAFALYLGRSHVGAVVTVRRVILAVFKGLLPLLVLITVLFLAALPFMGLNALWATHRATALMLTLQILFLFFLNAVFQNGLGEPPYPAWLRALVRAAIVALPFYTLLCAYALYLRIDQYGWSTDRFWATMLAFVVGLHAFGYATAALRRSGAWMSGMAPVNIAIAAAVVALAVAVNSPLLDSQRISAASQMARLLDGRIAAADFDYHYLRFDLGRAGNVVLAKLQDANLDHQHASAIRASAKQASERINRYGGPMEKIETTAQAARRFAVYPRGERLSESFLKYASGKQADWQLKRCFEAGQRCAVLVADMNGDKQKDCLLFRFAGPHDRAAVVFAKADERWQSVGAFALYNVPNPKTMDDLEGMLANAEYAFISNPWRNLRLGGHTQQFRPE